MFLSDAIGINQLLDIEKDIEITPTLIKVLDIEATPSIAVSPTFVMLFKNINGGFIISVILGIILFFLIVDFIQYLLRKIRNK